MKHPKKLSLELIEWDDASGSPSMSWRRVSDMPPLTRFKIVSVGFVALEDSKLVRLIHSIHAGKKKSKTASGFIDIPLGMITRRVKLSEVEA